MCEIYDTFSFQEETENFEKDILKKFEKTIGNQDVALFKIYILSYASGYNQN